MLPAALIPAHRSREAAPVAPPLLDTEQPSTQASLPEEAASNSAPPQGSKHVPAAAATHQRRPAAAGQPGILPPLPAALSVKERRARTQIDADPYNVGAWNVLIAEAQSRLASAAGTIAIWEHILAAFPTAGHLWKAYAEAQLAAGNDAAVRQIFGRCLLQCPHIELWNFYLFYIRKANEGRAEGREEVGKAFQFALDHIGLDMKAMPIWQEYIAFLRGAPAAGPSEESARMTAVRRVYQRAILVPMHMVELMWKDYEAFENSLSRPLAKGLLAEYQPGHSATRVVLRERKRLVDSCDFTALATPPSTPSSKEEELQYLAWRQLLLFERSNFQRLAPLALGKAVTFTYDQCLMYLYHYPDIWYDYATWHARHGSPDVAVQVFVRAIGALPDCEVLHFAYAEFEEARGRIQEARAVYEALLARGGGDNASALSHIQMMRFARRTEGVEVARKAFLAARKSPSCTYHVYIASALTELWLDKDAKVAKNVLELGLKKYIHEPAYVLMYVDVLSWLNDDRNMRALFERALSVLPASESSGVWNRYVECERNFGDLTSLLKVEQRRRRALAPDNDDSGDEDAANAVDTLEDVAARYAFQGLWPCSPAQLAHLGRLQSGADDGLTQKLVAGGQDDLVEERPLSAAMGAADASQQQRVSVRPDVAKMAVYDPSRGLRGPALLAQGGPFLGHAAMPGQPHLQMLPPTMPLAMPMPHATTPPLPPGAAPMPGHQPQAPQQQHHIVPLRPPPPLPTGPPPAQVAQLAGASGTTRLSGVDDKLLEQLPHAVAAFLRNLPQVPGPYPDVDWFMDLLLHTDLAQANSLPQGPGGAAKVLPSASASLQHGNKRKEPEGMANRGDGVEEIVAVSRSPPKDIFRMRQLQKSRGIAFVADGSSLSGTVSGDRPSGSSS